jgi:hypothetical protein
MHHSSRNTRGSTLVTVTILLGTMTVLALIFLRVGHRFGQEQDATLDSTRATLLAEAGISEAVEAIRAGQSGNVGSSDEPTYLGGGMLWVEATDLGNGRIQLDSIAMKDSGRAALRVVVEDEGGGGGGGGAGTDDGFVGMLFSNKHMQLDQNVMVDSYDSSLGTYASQAVNTYGGTTYAGSAGAASGNATIQLDANVKVFGDVHCGPGYTPTMAASTYVSGSTAANAQTITLTPVTIPVVASSGAYAVANNATATINPGTYHYTSVTQGKFSTLKVIGPATLVLDGYTTGQSATLQLDCTNGPITIYDTGVWSVDKNYTVGPVPGSPVDAALLISSTGTVQFDQGSKIYVGFYAPSATIQVDQGAECWGALVADEISVDQGTKFHFDENLRGFDLPWEVPAAAAADDAVDPGIVSWSKIEFPVRAYATDRRDPFTLLGVEKKDLMAPAAAWNEGGQ